MQQEIGRWGGSTGQTRRLSASIGGLVAIAVSGSFDDPSELPISCSPCSPNDVSAASQPGCKRGVGPDAQRDLRGSPAQIHSATLRSMDLALAEGGQPGEWLPIVLRRLQALANLPEGWDGRRAPRVSATSIEIEMQLLRRVMRSGTPIPDFVPTVRGGLQIEWHVPDVDIEFEIVSPGRYLLSVEDRAADTELDRELQADLSPFATAVERISSAR